jgi:hypothetical protein
MNKTVRRKKTSRSRYLLSGLMAICLTLASHDSIYASSIMPEKARCASTRMDTNTIHSIQVSMAQKNRKNKIKLYPDARQQVLFFSANGEDRRVYQLYLFDMDGKLVNQASIRNRETTVLSNITEGNYLFEVFSDDERIESGQLSVK